MKSICFLITTCLFALTNAAFNYSYDDCLDRDVPDESSVKLTYIMQIMCPNNWKFIETQLYPTFKLFRSQNMDVEILYDIITELPCGANSPTIKCQYGAQECLYSRLLACALSKIYYLSQKIDFLYCVQTNIKNYTSEMWALALQCCPQVNLNAQDVVQCVKDDEGTELLFSYKQKIDQLLVLPTFTPWLLFNDKYVRVAAQLGLTNLKDAMCSQYEQKKPTLCSSRDGELPTGPPWMTLPPRPIPPKVDVNLTVYVDMLCPYSLNFLKDQLYPTHSKLGDLFAFDVIPNAHVKVTNESGKWTFECLHGERECYLDKLAACALVRLESQARKIEFLKCIAENVDKFRENPSDLGRECYSRDFKKNAAMLECVRNKEGDRLMISYGEERVKLSPPLEYTPWLLFNGKFNESLSFMALQDLYRVICSLFKTKPEACKNVKEPESEQVSIHLNFGMLCPVTQKFIVEELYPAYKKLGHYLKLTLVPYGITKRREKTYVCQNGPEECTYNRMIGCGIEKASQNQKVDFLYCVALNMRSKTIGEVTTKCASKSNKTVQQIIRCTNSSEAFRIQESFEKLTKQLKPRIEFTPWMTFNGKYDETLRKWALYDFFEAICSQLTIKPLGCNLGAVTCLRSESAHQ